MGLQIIIPNVSFSNYMDITDYPISDSLAGLYYLGGTAEKSTYNYATKKIDASVVGSIAYADNYASFSGTNTTNNILTPLLDTTNNVTIAAIYRMPAALTAGGRHIFGNFLGGDNSLSIYNHNNAYVAVNGGSSATTNFYSTTPNSPPENLFHFRGATISGRSLQGFAGIGGELKQNIATTLAFDRGLSTRAMLIGGSYYATSYNDQTDIAIAAFHKTALTVANLQLVYEYTRSYCRKLGITVV